MSCKYGEVADYAMGGLARSCSFSEDGMTNLPVKTKQRNDWGIKLVPGLIMRLHRCEAFFVRWWLMNFAGLLRIAALFFMPQSSHCRSLSAHSLQAKIWSSWPTPLHNVKAAYTPVGRIICGPFAQKLEHREVGEVGRVQWRNALISYYSAEKLKANALSIGSEFE